MPDLSRTSGRRPLHLFHVFSSFCTGGAQMRAVQIMNHFRAGLEHTVFAMDNRFEASQEVNPAVPFKTVPFETPDDRGWPYIRHIVQELRAQRPDLLLTYNWGAIEATLAGRVMRICPILHFEDGFGLDEAQRLKTRRVLARRFILRGIFGTVVPSRTLQKIARNSFKLPDSRVRYIPNGVDVQRLSGACDPSWRCEAGISTDTVLFGSLGSLRPEKNYARLLRAWKTAALNNAKLVVIGDGQCRGELEQLSRALGISASVVFAGHVPDNARVVMSSLDVFLLSSDTEQMPLSLLEAAAAGLPAICTDVGDCRELVAAPNAEFIVPPGNVERYAAAMRYLAADPDLRLNIGRANRARCVEHYSLEQMMTRYQKLFEEAVS